MTAGSHKLDIRKKWWSVTLDENLVECRATVPREGHDRIKVLAGLLGEKLPILVGKLVISALTMYERGVEEVPEIAAAPQAAMAHPASKSSVGNSADDLCRAILSSRFPDDNGAARMRQCAMVTAIAVEAAAGHMPSVSTIARLTGNHPSQIMLLAQVLEDRNVLLRIHTPNVKKGRAAKMLQIRADAVVALDKIHLKATGRSIFHEAESGPVQDDASK
ncbi:hypothetical protein N2601_32465 (plasmid) [Rhizobium sp. CB3060]|uniref:hypothetical protein n=1 Tax=Rhizobium sp. CB3060 TaxID=3138255 RepID=UPI0021A49D1E|nr:hypothetical protein [Rhizobium tropici]UWU26043.1 hypothetical protein N2601_32465 [Rhizobium tropici]